MKKSFLLLALLVLFKLGTRAQTSPVTVTNSQISVKGAVLNIDNAVHDFGVIPYSGDGKHVFVVSNTGTVPLIIYNCIKGCGCTQVDWTKTPILPGEKGFVLATYNTKKVGEFNRGVDVYSNDASVPKLNIRLKGSVIVVPGGATPPIVTDTKSKTTKTNPAAAEGKW